MDAETTHQDPIGEVVTGTTVDVDDVGIYLDIDAELPGRISAEDLQWVGQSEIVVGDELTVLVKALEPGGAAYICSAAQADALSIWDALTVLVDSGDVIPCRVISLVRGGASVDLMGVRGFLPSSQVDLKPVDDLSGIVGESIAVRVLELDGQGQPVVSRRVLMEEEARELAQVRIETLEADQEVEGEVVRLTHFGAFIDIGDVDGLCRTPELSWGRVADPAEVVAVGDRVTAIITDLDVQRVRVGLSIKRLSEDPWLTVTDRYAIGDKKSGRIVSLTRYGAFVELEPGIEGLVHESEMDWGGSGGGSHEGSPIEVGAEIEVEVLEVTSDLETRRISLSRKRLIPDPLIAFAQAHEAGAVISGSVASAADFGVFVVVAEGVQGLVHRSEVSWTEDNPDLSAYEKGSSVDVKLVRVDLDDRRVALSIRQLTEDPWIQALEGLEVGAILKGRVARVAEFGAFVEIAEGVLGLCHISELAVERVAKVGQVCRVDDELEVYVLNIDRKKRKVSLSVKAVTMPPEPEPSPTDVKALDGEATTSLGSLLEGALGRGEDDEAGSE